MLCDVTIEIYIREQLRASKLHFNTMLTVHFSKVIFFIYDNFTLRCLQGSKGNISCLKNDNIENTQATQYGSDYSFHV